MATATSMALALTLCALATAATAEILQDIEPLDRLQDIKKKYPNARFTRVNAAWVQEDQAFFSMSGQGFPGTLYIAFDDYRPSWRHQLNKALESEPNRPANAIPIEQLQAFAAQTDDEALEVNWVRWAPTEPIPMSRVKAKFGEPTKCDFLKDDFRPFCEWRGRALLVNTTDDNKAATSFEAGFTADELRLAYQKKYGWVPEHLKTPLPSREPKKK